MRSGKLAFATIFMLGAGVASADTSLYTTQSDFTGWSNSGSSQINPSTIGPTAAFDADGATTNGLGNNPGNSGSTLGAGQTSTGGSLGITWGSSVGNFGVLAFSPGEAYNPAFMAAFDPGSVAAFQPPSFTSGSSAAYTGVLKMVYTQPDNNAASGGFFELGIDLAYEGDGFFGTFFPDSGNSAGVGSTQLLGTTAGGQQEFLATIPYHINAGSMSNFGVGIAYNSNFAPLNQFFVDSIALAPVPEPTSLGVMAIGGLLALRRRAR